MSALSSIFGTKKSSKETPQSAMIKIKETIETLTKKQEFIERQIEREIEIAKKNAKTNKRIAINALKKKKTLLDQLNHIDGTITNLESQARNLDYAALNMEAIEAMQTASKALKIAHKNLDIDRLQAVVGEIEEQRELAQQISDEISRPMGQDDYDEDELLAELNELQAEGSDAELLNKLLDVSVPSSELPAASSSSRVSDKTKKTEADQIASLEMWSG